MIPTHVCTHAQMRCIRNLLRRVIKGTIHSVIVMQTEATNAIATLFINGSTYKSDSDARPTNAIANVIVSHRSSQFIAELSIQRKYFVNLARFTRDAPQVSTKRLT